MISWLQIRTVVIVLVADSILCSVHAYVVVPKNSRNFGLGTSHNRPPRRKSSIIVLSQSNDSDEEIFTPTSQVENGDVEKSAAANNSKYLDDLTPPPVNFARNSILFSENPSTKIRNNSSLDAWKFLRTYSPAVLTGAWPWRDVPSMDERPLAALYNAFFVRLPIIAVGISYLYQKIALNHDLVMDFGFASGGPQAISPVLVVGILVLILL